MRCQSVFIISMFFFSVSFDSAIASTIARRFDGTPIRQPIEPNYPFIDYRVDPESALLPDCLVLPEHPGQVRFADLVLAAVSIWENSPGSYARFNDAGPVPETVVDGDYNSDDGDILFRSPGFLDIVLDDNTGSILRSKGRDPGTTLAAAFVVADENGLISDADIVIVRPSDCQNGDILGTLIHEIGHGLGLDHSTLRFDGYGQSVISEPFRPTMSALLENPAMDFWSRTLAFDDILGLKILYPEELGEGFLLSGRVVAESETGDFGVNVILHNDDDITAIAAQISGLPDGTLGSFAFVGIPAGRYFLAMENIYDEDQLFPFPSYYNPTRLFPDLVQVEPRWYPGVCDPDLAEMIEISSDLSSIVMSYAEIPSFAIFGPNQAKEGDEIALTILFDSPFDLSSINTVVEASNDIIEDFQVIDEDVILLALSDHAVVGAIDLIVRLSDGCSERTGKHLLSIVDLPGEDSYLSSDGEKVDEVSDIEPSDGEIPLDLPSDKVIEKDIGDGNYSGFDDAGEILEDGARADDLDSKIIENGDGMDEMDERIGESVETNDSSVPSLDPTTGIEPSDDRLVQTTLAPVYSDSDPKRTTKGGGCGLLKDENEDRNGMLALIGFTIVGFRSSRKRQ